MGIRGVFKRFRQNKKFTLIYKVKHLSEESESFRKYVRKGNQRVRTKICKREKKRI